MISLQRISKYVNRDESLDQLGNEQKRPLIQRLFKVDTSTLSIADEYDPYFENYSTQIKLFNFGPNSSALSVLERNRRLQPYLVSVVEKLLKEPKSSRQSVKEHLKQVAEEQTLQDRDEAFLDRSIDLALQVWLMLNSRDRANDTSPVTKWNETESLEDLVKDIFPVGDESTDLRFNYRFTAVNIERNSGVKIVWTRYLSEHLSFDDEQDYRKLKIFPDKNWLNDMLDLAKLKTPPESNDIPKHDESMADSGVPHRLGEAEVAKGEAATADGEAAKAKGEIRTTNDVHTSVHSSTANGSSKHTDKHSSVAAPESVQAIPLPTRLIEETLLSLDLLFPVQNKRTRDFLKRRKHSYIFYPQYATRRPILNDFSYWKPRLIDVLTEYQNPPRDLIHVWKDRRNPMARVTFWLGGCICVLTLVFGVIAALLAGYTLYAARNPPPPAPT